MVWEFILAILVLILIAGSSKLYGIARELRKKNHGLNAELSRKNRRSNHWKHYAHVLELRAFNRQIERDAFRAQYIHDFEGWGSHGAEEADTDRNTDRAV